MSDLRISQLPAATALTESDLTPISQLGGTATTRRATLSQLRPPIFDQTSVHVRDYGAVGNGTTNDAPAIQAAINAVKGLGGGVVRFGPRTYRLASAISIDGVAVRLEGAGFVEGPQPGDGTWLKVDSTGFTPITFSGVGARGSVVRDIAVTEIHTNAQNASWTPNAYDWFFRIVDCFGGVDFDNVFLAAVNKGFYCYNSGRSDFRRIRGQVFTYGIEIDQALDVPRMQNIHFWPFWSSNDNVLRWQQNNGDALVFKRADGPFIDQAFVLGYRSMFRFTASATGYTTKFYIGSAYADFCRFGVLIDSSGVNGQIANFTSQGEYWNAAGAPIAGSAGIFISGSNAQVQIGNLRIDQVEDNAIRLGGSGNRLDIFALRAVLFNTRNNAAPAIQVDNATGTPNRVHLGTPPILESANANILNNTDGNGVVQGRAPAGSVAKPGLAVGQDNSGVAAPSGQSLALSANGAEMLRITQGGSVTLGAGPGAHGFEVLAPANATNRLFVSGAASGGVPGLFSAGGDSNIGLLLVSKGNQPITAQTGGGTQLQVLHQANAVNAVQLFGAPTGAPARVGWIAAGADSHISAVIGQPKGQGAVLAQLPDSAASGGNARGANAVDLQTARSAAGQVASGANATISGGQSNTASGTHSVVSGGDSNTASGFKSSLGGGEFNSASGIFASVGGGVQNVISGTNSACPGGASAQDDGFLGLLCFASGQITSRGDAMDFRQVLRRSTTDATATRLTTSGSAPSTSNTVNLVNRSTIAGTYQVIAKRDGGTDCAIWRGNFSAVRGASAAATVLVDGGVSSAAPAASSGTGSAWRLDIAADTTNGGVAFSFTGAAATTVYAVATVNAVRTYTPT